MPYISDGGIRSALKRVERTRMDSSRPVAHTSLYSFVWRQRERGVIPYATNRDLRRTFKTLAGKAGLSKEIRDRLQNHALQDVSSKSYDRWNYMREKRAGMARWDKFVRALLAKRSKAAGDAYFPIEGTAAETLSGTA